MSEDPASEKRLSLEEKGHEARVKEPRKPKLRQPDTYWSWVVCVAGVTCNIIVLGCSYSYGILFPSLLDEFKKGKSTTGK